MVLNPGFAPDWFFLNPLSSLVDYLIYFQYKAPLLHGLKSLSCQCKFLPVMALNCFSLSLYLFLSFCLSFCPSIPHIEDDQFEQRPL